MQEGSREKRAERSDLSVGADEAGLQEVAGAPGVLALPHHVSGGVVGSITRGCPDLQRQEFTRNHTEGNPVVQSSDRTNTSRFKDEVFSFQI